MDPKKVLAAIDALVAGDADACMSILKEIVAAAAGAAAGADTTPPADAALASTADAPPTPPEEEQAALTALKRLTGKASAGEAVASYTEVLNRIKEIDARDAALDLSSRRELVADLVKLGVEFPATAWEGDPKDRKPVKRLQDEPLDALRERVSLHRKARPAELPPTPPPADAPDLTTLSRDVLEACKKAGITPEEFVARKATAVRRHK